VKDPRTSLDLSTALLESRIPGFALWRRGKVRDVYDLGDRLLIVATDRISAFDVVLPSGIPGKGVVLTQLSLFWFRLLKDVVPNHVLGSEVDDYGPEFLPYRDQLAGRSMLVVKTDPFPVECVVRGYLSGSGFKDYRKTGAVCGIPLPPGLGESDLLETPLFTPATKAETGHDENIPFERMAAIVGRERAAELRDLSLEIYSRARSHAEGRGIIIADTKFEFGLRDGRVVWIDEALTPDSSRFWPADSYRPGGAQPSYDKQYVRDHLEQSGWDKNPPAPPLPAPVVARTREKYLEAHARLTGVELR
jgi:phosphoribosylaminoimidazole-succinocarboxamide synthase